jgi:hypothetical protein
VQKIFNEPIDADRIQKRGCLTGQTSDRKLIFRRDLPVTVVLTLDHDASLESVLQMLLNQLIQLRERPTAANFSPTCGPYRLADSIVKQM